MIEMYEGSITILTLFRPRRDPEPELGEPRQPAGRRPGRGQGRQEEAAEEAEDPLYFAAAAGAGGPVRQEPLPRHVHKGGDLNVDQPHRAQS